jgi:hypothetical protein
VRPIAALARLPWPNTLPLLFMPMARAIGPLTMMAGVQALVVARTPCRPNTGVSAASTAVSTTGMYSGRQPAITALMAIFSTVQSVRLGGILPTTSRGERAVPSSIASTRSSVGGTTGKPSVQPRSAQASNGSAPAASSMRRDASPVLPYFTLSRTGMPGSTVSEPQPGR